ncbi:ATP-binding protein [Gimesia aquarii]|uniref:histidine kinase n=1 Tax=Gimesia aquarii TaxID=2527964 RepID=A0A517W0B2_9PLAN|nr:ATP-binding protein [Gimesia aquarii]QDT98692.1 Autoinducer 2 sensor kinase/phosphatase LuxQ [Gimesia aquarii]
MTKPQVSLLPLENLITEIEHSTVSNFNQALSDMHLLADMQLLSEQECQTKAQPKTCHETVLSNCTLALNHLQSTITRMKEEVHQLSSQFDENKNKTLESINSSLSDNENSELESTNAVIQSRSEFLANMTHEIRTPMTAILGFSELLENKDLTASQHSKAVQTIQRNGRYLLDLINDILDLSQVEAGKFEIEKRKTNPARMLLEIKESLNHRASAQNNKLLIELQGKIPQFIHTDPTRLKQALVNLTENAIKFTKHGTIRITVEHDPQQQRLCYYVTDTGIGIPLNQLQHIFQPFGQVDSSLTRKQSGIGLGLTMTQRIAKMLDGDVNVESTYGKGSKFTFHISTGDLSGVEMVTSLDCDKIRKSTPMEYSANSKINGRILLVEDRPDNQHLIRFILTKAGAEVTIAHNGKEGTELALIELQAKNPFDLILMDMQMPIMDGYEATQVLRNAGYKGQIVALTSEVRDAKLDKRLSAGFDGFLPKPIDRKTFIPEIAARMSLTLKNDQNQHPQVA